MVRELPGRLRIVTNDEFVLLLLVGVTEIIVPPRVDFKSRQFVLDLVDVIYKIAIATSVALTL